MSTKKATNYYHVIFSLDFHMKIKVRNFFYTLSFKFTNLYCNFILILIFKEQRQPQRR